MAEENGTRSKIGYGDESMVDEKIADSTFDGGDLIFTKQQGLIFLEPGTAKKLPIQTRATTYDDYDSAVSEINSDSSTYAGKPIMIKDSAGKYQQYIVQLEEDGTFALTSYGLTIVEF